MKIEPSVVLVTGITVQKPGVGSKWAFNPNGDFYWTTEDLKGPV